MALVTPVRCSTSIKSQYSATLLNAIVPTHLSADSLQHSTPTEKKAVQMQGTKCKCLKLYLESAFWLKYLHIKTHWKLLWTKQWLKPIRPLYRMLDSTNSHSSVSTTKWHPPSVAECCKLCNYTFTLEVTCRSSIAFKILQCAISTNSKFWN